MSAPMRGLGDQRMLAQLETLLGNRRDKQNSAVRWSDIATLRGQLIRAGGAGSIDAPSSPTGGGGKGDGTLLGDLLTRLDLAEKQIDAAEEEAEALRNQAQNAEAGAAAAQAMIQRGFGVILDQYLGAASGWAPWGAAEAITRTANEAFKYGQTWDFAVDEGQTAGVQIASTDATGWPGQKNAEGYVVEVEYTAVSGTMTGAFLMIRWGNNQGQSFDARKALTDLQAGNPVTPGTRVARGVFRRPSGFTGDFTSNTAYFFANFGAAPLPAKRIKAHRISIRVATQEELGAGEVLNNVQAYLTQNYYTATQSDQAIAESEDRIGAAVGPMSADVSRHNTAFASLNGSVARFRDVATVNGGQVAAGIEAVAWSSEGAGTGSLLMLIGDNVIAPGTLSANILVAGYGNNLCQNSRFYDGLTHWTASLGAETAFSIREPGQAYAHPSFRTMMLFQDGPASTANSTILYAPQQDGTLQRIPGAPCRPGTWYFASAFLSAHRCDARVQIRFYGETGNLIPTASGSSDVVDSSSSSANPDLWTRAAVKRQAPPGAAYVTLAATKTGTNAGSTDSYAFVWKPQIEETHAAAGSPGPYASNETSFMTGDMLFSRTLVGRHLVTNEAVITGQAQMGSAVIGAAQVIDASITNAKIGNVIQSDDFVAGPDGRGWRILKSGNAEFNTVTIRRNLAVATGTVNIGSFTPWARQLLFTPGTGGAPDTFSYPTGAEVNLFNGPGLVREVLSTPIQISEWQGTTKTFIATVGMLDGEVSKPGGMPSNQVMWGWTADVLPLTQWDTLNGGAQCLRLRLSFWSKNVTEVRDCVLQWRIYQVS